MTRFTKFKNIVSLVPGGPLQFLDIPINVNSLPGKVKSEFWEYYNEDTERFILKALNLDKESQSYQDRQTHDLAVDPRNNKKIDPFYSINLDKCLEPFLEKWVPVPFFRTEPSADDQITELRKGLSNWARLRIAALPEGDVDGYTHVLTFVFDVTIENKPDEGIPPTITQDDVQDSAEMMLAHEVSQYAWFLGEEWVDRWIQDLFLKFLNDKYPNRRASLERRDFKLEHIARYITLLDLLFITETVPKVRLINASQSIEPIEVDLILDIGNSRSCGMLIEQNDKGGPSLSNSYVLELRNMTAPENRYNEPFGSNICFSKCKFGDINDLSYMSNRETDPFDWPSLVRIGPEAELLSALSRQEEGQTFMSSPKRYLWDEKPCKQEWRYCPHPEAPDAQEEPVNTGTYALCINDMGMPTEDLDDPVTHPHFSRSSVMMFMLSEVLLQALVNINGPAQRTSRRNPDIPRRLGRLIITLPAAMPIAERNIFKRWANYAVTTLWKALGWTDLLEEKSAQPAGVIDFLNPPTVMVDWDEATSTQVVFLYNELVEKFAGDVDHYFNLKGKIRPSMGEQNSLRIASIDIGGGTSDLIVTTYERKQGKGPICSLDPHIDFREGFNVAGDDILKKVIENHFVAPLGKAIREAGVSDPADFLTISIGRDVADQSEHHRKMRHQFVSQVGTAFGLHILQLSEACDLREGDSIRTASFAEVYQNRIPPGSEAIELIDEGVRRAGGIGFTIRDLTISVDLVNVFATINSAIGDILQDLCEVINSFDCDLLVLSGRPSALPAVQATVMNLAPVAPDRIYPLSNYKVGKWYPYWSSGGRIKDPKTTVSVGAMLCLLSNGRLSNFNLRTSNLKPKSTARFIGLLDQNGKISNQNLLFAGIDLEKDIEEEKEAAVEFFGPTRIGFRQLGLERWAATPFYSLSYSEDAPTEDMKDSLPLKVNIVYVRPEQDDDGPKDELADEGVFQILEIEANDENRHFPNSFLELRLKTMLNEEGYWLDTGILDIPTIE